MKSRGLTSILCIVTLLFSSPSFCTTLSATASPLSPADQQIDHDLEALLTTQSEIKTEIESENLNLFEAAIKYNKSAAILTLAVSTVIAFFFVKEPIRFGTLYVINIGRFLRAMRLGQKLSSIEYMGAEKASTRVLTVSWSLSLASSAFYMSTRLYQKGVCLFNCLENFASRVSDDQQQEFLSSPTFAEIEKEIGHERAIRFVSIMGTLKEENFSNEKTMRSLARFVDLIAGQKINSLDRLEIPTAPTFSRVVQVVNGVYNINELVVGYLISSGQMT